MKSRAVTTVRISVSCIAAILLMVARQAQGSSAYLTNTGTSAVDAKGVRHNGNDYPGKHPPWLADLIESVAPNYPSWEQQKHHKGIALCQLTLDLKTGRVTKVTVAKSTGFPRLDGCAVAALRQWRWKPGKWKEIDIPVSFTIEEQFEPPGRIPLQPR
jgi:TonB family protein